MATEKIRIEKTIQKGDTRKTICVEEVENGFFVTIDISSHEDGEYKYECKKYISETNPLEDLKASKEPEEKVSLMEAIKSINPKSLY